MRDLLGYQGKRVVITGAASGMAQEAARLLVELGAEVYALDIKEINVPVKQYINTNLMEKDSINAAVKKIPSDIYALFNCAGLPGPPWSNLEVTLVNFVGHRHLTESLLPKINDGGAIAFISSIAAIAWRRRLDTINKLLATTSFDEACTWLEANNEVNTDYRFSKQCICAYVKTRAMDLAKKNIRINCILPGPTDTPMLPRFIEDADIPGLSRNEAADRIRRFTESTRGLCGRYATAEEQAEPLVFLNSNMARFISGVEICIDFGLVASVEVGQTHDSPFRP